MRWILPLAKLLLVFAIGALAPSVAVAKDVSMDNLLGHWCGPTADYTFTRTELKVRLHNRHRTLTHGSVLQIEDVEVGDGWINLKWKDTGNTVFWKFSADGRVMYQHANESGDRGPQMKFRRC